jgi:hypothetical protein
MEVPCHESEEAEKTKEIEWEKRSFLRKQRTVPRIQWERVDIFLQW